MKTHTATRSTSAFTLIELLIVISIIAILSSLIVAGASSAIRTANNVACKAVITEINSAIRNYQSEYNRLPIAPGSSEQVIEFSAGNPVLGTLLGVGANKLNPQHTRFMEPHPGKHGIDGLVGDDGSYALMDHWGQAYRVLLDADGDGRIANPDRQSPDEAIASNTSTSLLMPSAVFSLGADKTANTKDDVCSWR